MDEGTVLHKHYFLLACTMISFNFLEKYIDESGV